MFISVKVGDFFITCFPKSVYKGPSPTQTGIAASWNHGTLIHELDKDNDWATYSSWISRHDPSLSCLNNISLFWKVNNLEAAIALMRFSSKRF